MNSAVAILYAVSFFATTLGLIALIWAITRGQLEHGSSGARVIFRPGELGRTEDPAGTAEERARLDVASGRASKSSEREDDDETRAEIEARRIADTSSRGPVLFHLVSSVIWLLVGSCAGIIVSLKFTLPDWLTSSPLLTFGRLRPLHLNAVIYGWLSMNGIAVALWLFPRLLRTPLRGGRFAIAGGVLWNLGMIMGSLSILLGWSDGLEWLEFPWQVDALIVIGGALAGIPLLVTLAARKVEHLYVSVWYLLAAFLWFPIIFLVANIPHTFTGVDNAVMNWWYAHNVLGLWVTPIGLASAYYFIPKVVGRPVYSYQLSLIGFWSLAMFYSQAGIHHLIGGPIPTWLVTTSIVMSIGMVFPVVAVAVNHHYTMKGRFSALKHSPTLRFIVSGAMMYTLVSLQGSMEALRSVSRVVHFTHYTVAHAHFGVYGFASFIAFGSVYFLLPRLIEREWPYPALIKWHFWLAIGGFAVYFFSLSVGGVLQGLAMLDAKRPFLDSLNVTIPFLWGRTAGGALMVVAHFVFAFHVFAMIGWRGPARESVAWARPLEATTP
jgi:cytochrome c oxidase cbb3-type subunit 1